MRLLPGTAAPECTLTTVRGESTPLTALRGAPVWLAFSRFAACPLCNFRIHQIVGQWPQRFAGTRLRLFVIFQSPAAKLAEYVATQEAPFDLVADPTMDLYRLFRVERSLPKMVSFHALKVAVSAVAEGLVVPAGPDGPITRVPADFLIDPSGVIRVARYGENITDHIALDRVADFVERHGG